MALDSSMGGSFLSGDTEQNAKYTDLLSSMEKTLREQTAFLKELAQTQEEAQDIAEEAAEDAKRAQEQERIAREDEKRDRQRKERKAQVTEEEEKKGMAGLLANAGADGRDARNRFGAFAQGAKQKGGGLLSTILGRGPLLLGFPAVAGFIEGFVNELAKNLFKDVSEAGEDASFMQRALAGIVNTKGLGNAILGGLVGLLFGRPLAGAISFFAYSNLKDSELFKNVDGATMLALAGAIGVALSFAIPALIMSAFGLAARKLAKAPGALKDFFQKNPKQLDMLDEDGKPKKNAKGGTRVKVPKTPPKGVTPMDVKGDLLDEDAIRKLQQGDPKDELSRRRRQRGPSGSRVSGTGKVVPLKNKDGLTPDQVREKLKLKGELDRLSKYSRFLKFAGPALSVIPALIDPLMAIQNGEPDDVIQKKIVAALGSIGGATLGAIAGGLLGTKVPIIGNVLGATIGGIAGAFSGQSIAELVADLLIKGDEGSFTPNIPAPVVDPFNNQPMVPASTSTRRGRSIDLLTSGPGTMTGLGNTIAVNTGGNNIDSSTNVGGSTSTVNIFNSGNSSLSNPSHLPVSQSA